MFKSSAAAAAAAFLMLLASAPVFAKDIAFGPLTGKLVGAPADKLVVFVHGDVSRGGPADYMYRYADQVGGFPGVAAAAVLRPGYSDDEGRKSTGSHNRRRDHYTARNNALLADTLRDLKAKSGAKTLIVIGHSGGAAQTGVVLGQQPGLIDKAILVSCPCDVPTWRRKRNRKAWRNSQSPHQFAARVPAGTEIVLITGGADKNTPPYLANDYAKSSPAKTRVVILPGKRHGFNGLWGGVSKELASLL